MGLDLVLILFCLLSSILPLYGYDPLDPDGNISIKWDIMQWNDETYDVKVSIANHQLFRHVEHPGWRVSWTWGSDEVIWSMWGAEATEQGNCSNSWGRIPAPHSCEKKPMIVDLLPGAPYKLQVANCCRGGVLSTPTQDPSRSLSTFQMSVGVPSYGGGYNNAIPGNFTLGLMGYSCGDPQLVRPSRFPADPGRRWTQALATWKITCSYSQFRASPVPTCCVSLSAFYNATIVPCPQCSCGCQRQPNGHKCIRMSETLPQLRLPRSHEEVFSEVDKQACVRCSRHMCPISVHWHVKQSYRQYWRVKITITNLSYAKNYTNWNLVVLHPNLANVTEVFSFNYYPLHQEGYINDTGVFWGLRHYNDLLLQSGDEGNVQTEMLMHKDKGLFTFRDGWGFPRKISFNGDACVMPPPDKFPTLPNQALFLTPYTFIPLLIITPLFF